VKIRPRLLVTSLTVALVVSVLVGWLIARSGGNSSNGTTTRSTFAPPAIATNAPVRGKRLADATVQTLKGVDVTTASLLGEPLVINIWGSTCGPCKKELPDFAAVQQQFVGKVRFVGIDYLPPSDDEEKFARSRGVKYDLFYDTNGDFISKVGIGAFPVTLFVTADGTIVQQTGQLDAAKLTTLAQALLS
jgi:thiol-disulfide isomerase/thioredoxin